MKSINTCEDRIEFELNKLLIGPSLPDLNNLEAPIAYSMIDDIEDEETDNMGNMRHYDQVKMEEEHVFYPTPEEFQVKVFVINMDGNWSDCGVGMLIFMNNFDIVVCTDGNDQAGKDFMDDKRERALRNYLGKCSESLLGKDRGDLIIKVDLREAKLFTKSQSKDFYFLRIRWGFNNLTGLKDTIST